MCTSPDVTILCCYCCSLCRFIFRKSVNVKAGMRRCDISILWFICCRIPHFALRKFQTNFLPRSTQKRPTQNHPQQFYASQFEICFWLDSTRSAAAVHKAHSLCIQWMNSEFNFDKTSQNKSLIAVHEIVKPCEPLFRVPRHPWIRPTMPAIYTWNFPWSDVADVIILDCIFVKCGMVSLVGRAEAWIGYKLLL